MSVWPVRNVEKIREDAASGLTWRQCAQKRGFHEDTIKKHAALNGIVFPARPNRALTYDELRSDKPNPDQLEQWQARAKAELKEEIALAKQEAKFAPPFKGAFG